VILEVSDTGKPRLTSYRRAIVKVSGKPIPPPPGAFGVEEDLTQPITKLDGPAAEDGSWRFWRAVNINGKPIEIDGNPWDGDSAPNFVCQDRPLNSPHGPLLPPTDTARAEMIHAFRWNHNCRVELTDVAKGTYAVYAYVWEETAPTTFTVRVNDRVVCREYCSGPAGRWCRLGPWTADVGDGKIVVTSSGGDANFSGIEVWQRAGGSK
jgi:hypothetical protein